MVEDSQLLTEKKVGLAKRAWKEFVDMNKFQKSMVIVPVMCFLVLLTLVVTGCTSNPNRDLIKLELENVNKMLKDYPQRIQADKEWSDITKKVYIRWLNSWKTRLTRQLEAVDLADKNEGG